MLGREAHEGPTGFLGEPRIKSEEWVEWAYFEDTGNILTQGPPRAQVLVGVKKSRPRWVWTKRRFIAILRCFKHVAENAGFAPQECARGL